MNFYERGDTTRMTGAFTDSTGAPANPTATSFSILTPAGTTTTYVYPTDVQIVRDSTGNFHVDWPLAIEGLHYYRFLGSGAVARSVTNSLSVRDTPW